MARVFKWHKTLRTFFTAMEGSAPLVYIGRLKPRHRYRLTVEEEWTKESWWATHPPPHGRPKKNGSRR